MSHEMEWQSEDAVWWLRFVDQIDDRIFASNYKVWQDNRDYGEGYWFWSLTLHENGLYVGEISDSEWYETATEAMVAAEEFNLNNPLSEYID